MNLMCVGREIAFARGYKLGNSPFCTYFETQVLISVGQKCAGTQARTRLLFGTPLESARAYNILNHPLGFEDVLCDMSFPIVVLLFSSIQAYGSWPVGRPGLIFHVQQTANWLAKAAVERQVLTPQSQNKTRADFGREWTLPLHWRTWWLHCIDHFEPWLGRGGNIFMKWESP